MKRWWQMGLVASLLVLFSLHIGKAQLLGLGMVKRPSVVWAQGIVAESIDATLTVTPSAPKVNDPVQVTVSGVWSDGCVPDQLSHVITDRTIAIVIAMPDPMLVCGQAFTPWSLMVDLGKLPQAEYHVQVSGAVTLSTTLSITGHAIYLPTVTGP